MIKKSLFISACLILLATADLLYAQPQTGTFQREMQAYNSHYWAKVPEKYNPKNPAPLIVALHGAGGRADNFLNAFSRTSDDYIIMAPKSPGQSWNDQDSKFMLACIDDLRKDYKIDEGRIYLVGFSAGSHVGLVWGLMHHELFAGVVPVGGGCIMPSGDLKKARLVQVYFLIGVQDPNCPPAKEISNRLRKEGFNVKFEEVPNLGHVWPQNADQKIMEWFESFGSGAFYRLFQGTEVITNEKGEKVINGINENIEKPVMIYFHLESDQKKDKQAIERCRYLEKTIINDKVRELCDQFLCIRINTNNLDKEIKDRYKVKTIPTIVFCGPKGEIIKSITKHTVSTAELVKTMKEVIKKASAEKK